MDSAGLSEGKRSGRPEHFVEVPLQELAVRPVSTARWQFDDLSRLGIELLAVAELLAQPGTDHEPVCGVHAQVAAVEHGVHIRSEQQAIVQPVLAAPGDGADVRGLENGRDVDTNPLKKPPPTILLCG